MGVLGLPSVGGKVKRTLPAVVGSTGDPPAPPAPAAPTHSFSITVGGRGTTRGYNRPGNFGAIVAGSTADYQTPGGKDVSVIHARRLGADELVFALSGAAQDAADFPGRIVATKTTGDEAVVECVPKNPEDMRAVQGGVRRDYGVDSGLLTDVFAANQTVRIDLFY